MESIERGVCSLRSGEHENNETNPIIKTAVYPVELYQSLLGRYFTAETPHLVVGGAAAWGAIANPPDSGINLHMNVVTLNYVYGEPLTIGFYMNAELPGNPHVSGGFAPANTAICPLPEPMCRLLYVSDTPGSPIGGVFTFSRTTYPGQLTMLEKNGAFVVPPGGNYCAFVRPLMRGQDESRIYLAFGWYEEPV